MEFRLGEDTSVNDGKLRPASEYPDTKALHETICNIK